MALVATGDIDPAVLAEYLPKRWQARSERRRGEAREEP